MHIKIGNIQNYVCIYIYIYTHAYLYMYTDFPRVQGSRFRLLLQDPT